MNRVFRIKQNSPEREVNNKGKEEWQKPFTKYSVMMKNSPIAHIPDYLEDPRGMAELLAELLNKSDKIYSVDTLSFRVKGKKVKSKLNR